MKNIKEPERCKANVELHIHSLSEKQIKKLEKKTER